MVHFGVIIKLGGEKIHKYENIKTKKANIISASNKKKDLKVSFRDTAGNHLKMR